MSNGKRARDDSMIRKRKADDISESSYENHVSVGLNTLVDENMKEDNADIKKTNLDAIAHLFKRSRPMVRPPHPPLPLSLPLSLPSLAPIPQSLAHLPIYSLPHTSTTDEICKVDQRMGTTLQLENKYASATSLPNYSLQSLHSLESLKLPQQSLEQLPNQSPQQTKIVHANGLIHPVPSLVESASPRQGLYDTLPSLPPGSLSLSSGPLSSGPSSLGQTSSRLEDQKTFETLMNTNMPTGASRLKQTKELLSINLSHPHLPLSSQLNPLLPNLPRTFPLPLRSTITLPASISSRSVLPNQTQVGHPLPPQAVVEAAIAAQKSFKDIPSLKDIPFTVGGNKSELEIYKLKKATNPCARLNCPGDAVRPLKSDESKKKYCWACHSYAKKHNGAERPDALITQYKNREGRLICIAKGCKRMAWQDGKNKCHAHYLVDAAQRKLQKNKEKQIKEKVIKIHMQFKRDSKNEQPVLVNFTPAEEKNQQIINDAMTSIINNEYVGSFTLSCDKTVVIPQETSNS